jgi:hypothetical protein
MCYYLDINMQYLKYEEKYIIILFVELLNLNCIYFLNYLYNIFD